MKKILFMLGLFALLGISQSQAQFITYDPAQFANALIQIGKSTAHIAKAVETINQIKKHIETAKQTKQQLEEIWALQQQVQADLKKLKGLKDLKWHDLQNIFENAMFLVDDPAGYLRYQMPAVSQLHHKLTGGSTAGDVKALYEYFYRFNTAYDPAVDYDEQTEQDYQMKERRYAAELMLQKRKFHLAMSYANMAEEMAVKAEELRLKVKAENELEMTAGERILAQKAAQDAMIQSIELQEKSAVMLAEAMQKGQVQQGIDKNARLSNRLQQQALAYRSIIPGMQ
ncbi:MAG: hypothetical protein AAF927_03795 [Bacteroidota bacterium]